MKILNILNSVLKDSLKGDLTKWSYFADDEYLYIGDNYHVFKLEDMENLIDVEKLECLGLRKSPVLTKIFGNEPQFDAQRTGFLKEDGKNTYIELTCHGEFVYLNEKYLRCFERPIFKGTNSTSVVFVYEGSQLRGVVCPMRFKD